MGPKKPRAPKSTAKKDDDGIEAAAAATALNPAEEGLSAKDTRLQAITNARTLAKLVTDVDQLKTLVVAVHGFVKELAPSTRGAAGPSTGALVLDHAFPLKDVLYINGALSRDVFARTPCRRAHPVSHTIYVYISIYIYVSVNTCVNS